MGCEFNFQRLIAKADADATKEVDGIIERAAWDHGHAGYSGSFAEAQGSVINPCPEHVTNLEQASSWLGEHAEKWGPAVISKLPDGTYFVGANCSS